MILNGVNNVSFTFNFLLKMINPGILLQLTHSNLYKKFKISLRAYKTFKCLGNLWFAK